MKYWSEILDTIPVISKSETGDFEFDGIAINSREVKPGNLFIAKKGISSDGHDYISQAIQNGAVAVIGTELKILKRSNVPWIQTDANLNYIAKIAATYYGEASTRFKLIGITGTNGKTTIASLLYDLFTGLGFKAGLISTIDIKAGNIVRSTTHTTPDAMQLQKTFAWMAEEECSYVFMEVSSHAIVQGRIDYSDFDLGVFTNISHDHLDYHGSFKEYIKAKQMFFDQLSSESMAITNKDDRNGELMVQNSKAKVKTYGVKQIADYKCKVISSDSSGLELEINGQLSFFKIAGQFNAYNLTAAYSVAVELEQESDTVLRILSALKPAKGRLEKVQLEGIGFTVFIDYAHTPDALENVLSTLNEMLIKGSRVITVVGCGGDRDKLKRPKMAKIAYDNSDLVIFTSDNPRSEDPDEILNEMEMGVEDFNKNKKLRISDREMAIKAACMIATKNDLVLIAGKGHEDYQEIKGVKMPFEDKKVVKATLLKT